MKPSEVVKRIYATYEKDERPRAYLGASSVGRALQCKRRAWLEFRAAASAQFDGRMLRLFQTGHREEDRVIQDLINAGFEFEGAQLGGGTTTQIGVQAFQGLFRGHTDGLVRAPGGEWHLFECKTANERAFKLHTGTSRTPGKPVIEAKPVHYAQIQVYMGLLNAGQMPEGLGDAPRKALYLVVHKDTDKIHAEIVDFDADFFDELGNIVREILEANEPFPAPWKAPSAKHCTYCDCNHICWDKQEPAQVCGTCVNFRINTEDGSRVCLLHETATLQHETCTHHVWAEWVERNETVSFWL